MADLISFILEKIKTSHQVILPERLTWLVSIN